MSKMEPIHAFQGTRYQMKAPRNEKYRICFGDKFVNDWRREIRSKMDRKSQSKEIPSSGEPNPVQLSLQPPQLPATPCENHTGGSRFWEKNHRCRAVAELETRLPTDQVRSSTRAGRGVAEVRTRGDDRSRALTSSRRSVRSWNS